MLNWQSVPGAASYIIQVDDGSAFVDIGTKTSVWFTHRYLAAGTSYDCRVIAVDAAGTRGTPSATLMVATFP